MYVVYINLLYFLSIFLFTYNKNLLSQKKLIVDLFALKELQSYFSIFLMENSILYAKIAVYEKNFFPKLSFKYYIGLLFS